MNQTEVNPDPKVKTGIYNAATGAYLAHAGSLSGDPDFRPSQRRHPVGIWFTGRYSDPSGDAWCIAGSGVGQVHRYHRGSLLAGIGFTMSIFVAQRGRGGREDLLLMAKTGILAASMLAGVAGFIWLYLVSKPVEAED
ncbi:hypothetical protein PN36_30590 [Candidatus Thiomargarita nelsonii]|uniref:Uncharacterized protein n=1 Tax=Candidatus Thiomargarita nelsonii TaxID=1003181 RepID=A0A0A6PLD4_9GAMM|nr:hypothetical protein PN36_30590 [Candidatus Thiomargarita nelsonii]